MADIVFTNVPLLKTCIGGLCPSLTFLQLASYLESVGFSVVIHDIAVEQDIRAIPMEEVTVAIAERVAMEAPAVLGLSCKVPADGRFTRDLAREVKKRLPNITIVVGGIWATPCYRGILERIPEVDAVVLGEGELALAAICEGVCRGRNPFEGQVSVPGTAYRGAGGEVLVSPSRVPLLPSEHPLLNLELLPAPDTYTVFPYLTSKGCPYKCTFCAERIIYPHHVETPVPRLKQDLDHLDKFGRDYFLWMSDPLFGADPERLEAISSILGDTKFHFLLESRVDVLRPEQLQTLWRAGCDLIYFGLESASFDSLRRIGKVRNAAGFERYLRQARALMAACMEADITPVFGVINPVPGDSIDDLRKTYAFLSELAEIARRTSDHAGTDPGYHFYSFNYRLIRGTIDFERLDDLAGRGASWLQDPDDIFVDVVLSSASSQVSPSVAQEFHRKVRGLVHTTPKGWERLQRSFPPQPLGGLG